MNKAVSQRIADDFVVPAGQTWKIDTFIIYGYQTGSTTTSSFTSAALQIFQNTITGTSVFGDTTTNRMVSSEFAGYYRVGTDSSAVNRPIMAVKIAVVPAKTLTAGTYWASWSTTGSIASGPWCPPKVGPGKVNPAGQNGMQFINGAWAPAVDSFNLGFNMMLKSATPSAVVNVAQPSISEVSMLPNPAGDIAKLQVTLNAATTVSVKMWNSAGQLVRTIATNQQMAAGTHDLEINVSDLAAGNYFVELNTPEGRHSKQVQVAR